MRADRASLLANNAWHAFLFIALAAGSLVLYMRGKLKPVAASVLLAAFTIVDLWMIDRHYVGEQNFYPKRKIRAVIPSDADRLILEDTDPNYRVFNATVNTFNENGTSNFHKSIGGYSPMKLRRYQDIIDFHFSRGINVKVLNMLNTRYFIVPDASGQPTVQRNVAALGNAWFVDSVRWVNSPDEEIRALYDFEPARTAVIDREWTEKVGSTQAEYPSVDPAEDKVKLVYYQPNHLKYEYTASASRPLVFSEVYYKTWKAFVDGQEVPLYRVDYILRGITAPQGRHTVELKCRNELIAKSRLLTNIGSGLNVAAILLIIAMLVYKRRKS